MGKSTVIFLFVIVLSSIVIFPFTGTVVAATDDKIVFDTFRNNNREIYIMDGDGTNPEQITNNSFIDMEPELSPDGTKVVFRSIRNDNMTSMSSILIELKNED